MFTIHELKQELRELITHKDEDIRDRITDLIECGVSPERAKEEATADLEFEIERVRDEIYEMEQKAKAIRHLKVVK
jgi:hypothetical protein